MKKFVICLFMVLILAFPLSAVALDPAPATDTIILSGDSGDEEPTVPPVVDIKGYGNQFADYSTGILNIDSWTDSYSQGSSVEWTGFNNVVGDPFACDGPGCGMNLTQGTYTVTDLFTNTTHTEITGKNLIGAADMTTLGGLAACVSGTEIPAFDASLYQTQTVTNNTSGWIDGVYGSASYEGTQTLNLQLP